MAVPTQPSSSTPTLVPWHWLVAVLGVAVYFAALHSLPQLAQKNDAVGEADAASYLTLLSDWDLTRVYGDAYVLPPRVESVVAQEHKIKHVLYPMLLSPVVSGLEFAGLSPLESARLTSALTGAATLLLFCWLLAYLGVSTRVAVPAALLLVVAPTMWIYHGVPESWPLTGLLFLLGIYLHLTRPQSTPGLALFAGVGMLCSIVLGFLVVLPALAQMQRTGVRLAAVILGARDGAIALATFALCLWALSFAAPELRPDRVWFFMTFFRTLFEHADPLTLAAAKATVVQLLVLPFATFQANHDLTGDWGAGFTIDHSTTGAVAVFWMIAFWCLLVAASGLWLVRRREWSVIVHGAEARIAAFWLLVVLFLHVGHYQSMFLYSSALVPLVLALGTWLGTKALPRMEILLWLTLAATVPASIGQWALLRRLISQL